MFNAFFLGYFSLLNKQTACPGFWRFYFLKFVLPIGVSNYDHKAQPFLNKTRNVFCRLTSPSARLPASGQGSGGIGFSSLWTAFLKQYFLKIPWLNYTGKKQKWLCNKAKLEYN